MNVLQSKKIGALVRVFAKKPELVSDTVKQTMDLINKIQALKISGTPFVSHIMILVPCDTRYSDVDCGETAQALRGALSDEDIEMSIEVSELAHGDIFCGILNYGMARLLSVGCEYGLVISKEASSYLNQESAMAIIEAVEDGALVTGLAINELTESVMQGRIANTLGLWHIISLMQVGGFDLRSAKPERNAVIVHKVRAWGTNRDEPSWAYDLAGVEEIIPLVRMVQTFGECIAPLLPKGNDVQQYVVPDPKVDTEGYIRHVNKMGTKRERQTYFANTEGADLTYLMGGVMKKHLNPKYIR